MVVGARTASDPIDRNAAGAFAWCRNFASEHQENFTVISWCLPRNLRPHFAALYAYCRLTDDIGDEAQGDRVALLDEWEDELRRCLAGDAARPLFVALNETIARYSIPAEQLSRLIEANRMDQQQRRYSTYADLLRYCSYSATPVGRMVLAVLGYHDEERGSLADATCIGLQLANFWQDVSIDARKGRIYLPKEDMERFSVSEGEIIAGEDSERSRRLIQFECSRAREFLHIGKELESHIDRRSRLDVRLFRLGGETVLNAIEHAHFAVLGARPRVPRSQKTWLAMVNGFRIKLGI